MQKCDYDENCECGTCDDTNCEAHGHFKDCSVMSLSEMKEQLFNVEKYDNIAIFAEYEVTEDSEVPSEDILNFMAWNNPDTFENVMELVLNDEELKEDFLKYPRNTIISVISNPTSTI